MLDWAGKERRVGLRRARPSVNALPPFTAARAASVAPHVSRRREPRRVTLSSAGLFLCVSIIKLWTYDDLHAEEKQQNTAGPI